MSIQTVENYILVAQQSLHHALEALAALADEDEPPDRVLFCSPVTGQIESWSNIWGGDWFDATGYAKLYTSNGASACHTGADLNRPAYRDSGTPVFAAADGIVKFCGQIATWQGDVVIVEHLLEDGSLVWTRYAHIIHDTLYQHPVKRGERIGVIADYNKDGPRYDHLHFDVIKIDLTTRPGDWPGTDKPRLLQSYANPETWLREHAQ